MTSVKRQLPYDYYSLPFCKPEDGKLRYKPENLGEILRGDRIVNTPYEVGTCYPDELSQCCLKVSVKQPIGCKVVCGGNKPMQLNKDQSNLFVNMIKEDYTLHM